MNRFKEPSTYASVSAILTMVGSYFGGQIDLMTLIPAVVAGGLGVVLGEQGGRKI